MTGSVSNKNLLIVEDNRALLTGIKQWFCGVNSVTTAETLAEAKRAVFERFFDIILLDVVLPDGNGLDLIPLLKNKTPVIVLSDLGEDDNILDGLDAGACDYVVKPCSMKILEKRISLRLLPEPEAILNLYGMTVNSRLRTAEFHGKALSLTSSEFNILFFLMQHTGKFFTSNEIYEEVWQMPHLNSGTIRYHMHNLRKKMNDISQECGALIAAEFGRGYTFIGEAADEK